MKLAAYTISIITAFGFATQAAAAPQPGARRSATTASTPAAASRMPSRMRIRATRCKNLVGRICKPDSEDNEHMKELEAARQRWSTRLDLTEADWADVADYATLGQGERMNGEVRINTNGQEMGIGDSLKRAWSGFDALDQYAMIGSATPVPRATSRSTTTISSTRSGPSSPRRGGSPTSGGASRAAATAPCSGRCVRATSPSSISRSSAPSCAPTRSIAAPTRCASGSRSTSSSRSSRRTPPRSRS